MSDYSSKQDGALSEVAKVRSTDFSEEPVLEGTSTFASVPSTSDTVYEFPAAAGNEVPSGSAFSTPTELNSQNNVPEVFSADTLEYQDLQNFPAPHSMPTIQGSEVAKTPSIFWRLFAAFFVGGVVAAVGFGSAFFLIKRTDSGAAPTVTTPIIDAEGGEPAIFVAEALGPAIVQMETDIGSGSGVVYREGLILTNYHVVEGADQVNVRQSNGRLLEGEVVGSDERIDIAVVSVESSVGLPVAPLALEESAKVGQIAVAIGSPFQLQQTVTDGIVSAVNRPLLNVDGQSFKPMIQTNAAINPGNSGGALADIRGRVIGINTAIQTDGSDSTNAGIGFAIPIDLAVKVADLLVEGKSIESGLLGVEGALPSSNNEVGVEIAKITEGSAAEEAGLQVGDRILTVDGAPVASFAELAGLVGVRQPGDEVELQVARNNSEEPLIVVARLGSR